MKIPGNFEVEINANTKKEALKKVLGKYEDGEFDGDDIADLRWKDVELDINEKGNINDIGNGICIDEI